MQPIKSVTPILILAVLTGHVYCKTLVWKPKSDFPATANTLNYGLSEDGDKGSAQAAVDKLRHHSYLHSDTPSPTLANSLEHHTSHLDIEEDKSELHSPAMATIVHHDIPEKSISGGAAIVTGHLNPTHKYPGMTLTSVSSYSDSNSSYIPALAISSTSANSAPLAIFGKLPEMSLTTATTTQHKPLSLRLPLLGKETGHESKTVASADPPRPSSLWDRAHKYDSESTESTVERIPLTLSAIKEYTTPVWSFFTNSIPKLSFGVSNESQKEKERPEFIIPEDKIPKFANMKEESETNLTKNHMKFEDVWHTNRQKWEIPLDETLLQSVEFNNFWKLYQQYLHQQMQQPNPSQSILSDTLDRPTKPNVVHTQSHNYLPNQVDCSTSENENLSLVIKQDSFSCGHFFRCVSGAPIRFTCPEGTLFSTVLKGCIHTDTVDCGTRP